MKKLLQYFPKLNYVYFFSYKKLLEEGQAKIGETDNPNRRLKELCAEHKQNVRDVKFVPILAPYNVSDHYIHKVFQHQNIPKVIK
jgi:hypothetical protein